MASRKIRKAAKSAKVPKDIQAPTAEQMASGQFTIDDVTDKRNGGGSITIGKAYRRKPMIDTLRDKGLLSHGEHKALSHYRHFASILDRSLIRDSLCVERFGGSGTGPTAEMLTATQVVRDCEAAAGSLRDILRAVVVDDLTLSQWAISQSGSVEQCRDRPKGRVCTIEPKQRALRIAQLEMKMVAGRVESELRS